MSWNWSGKNWEGRNFNTPMSLRSLGGQVDAEYPDRPRNADGTVASKNHDANSPSSEHRPHPISGAGIVRGIDITVTPAMGDVITEALRLSRDRRIKYVIWNRRSFRPPTWVWKPYNLAPHDKHFHVSFKTLGDNNSQPWTFTTSQPIPTPPPGDPMWQKPGDPVDDVADADAVLNYQGVFAPGQGQASYEPANLAEANDRLWITLARVTDWAMRNAK